MCFNSASFWDSHATTSILNPWLCWWTCKFHWLYAPVQILCAYLFGWSFKDLTSFDRTSHWYWRAHFSNFVKRSSSLNFCFWKWEYRSIICSSLTVALRNVNCSSYCAPCRLKVLSISPFCWYLIFSIWLMVCFSNCSLICIIWRKKKKCNNFW